MLRCSGPFELNLPVLYDVFYISFENGSSIDDKRSAIKQEETQYFPPFRYLKALLKLQLFTRSLPRNSKFSDPGEINLFADNDKKQADVESRH